MFATTTCLDHARLLQRPEIRDLICSRMIADVQRYGAVLHAFSVMPDHLHMLIRAPDDKTISWFMQRFKSNSAKDIAPLLLPSELAQIKSYGKKNRTFWEPSFHGPGVRDERMFWSVGRYIHLNPLRAGLCDSTLSYRWSSASMYENLQWNDESGVNDAVRMQWPDDPPEWAHRLK